MNIVVDFTFKRLKFPCVPNFPLSTPASILVTWHHDCTIHEVLPSIRHVQKGIRKKIQSTVQNFVNLLHLRALNYEPNKTLRFCVNFILFYFIIWVFIHPFSMTLLFNSLKSTSHRNSSRSRASSLVHEIRIENTGKSWLKHGKA